MPDTDQPRASFIDRVLTSTLPGEVAKRFSFADGEVGALCTLIRKPQADAAQLVVLIVATFPPTLPRPGVHDFGLDYCERPVASVEEAHALLAQFDQAQAARFRASCRAAHVA